MPLPTGPAGSVSTAGEQAVADTFAELSDTAVDAFDMVDFLHGLTGRCVDLMAVQAAGVMLADERGALRVLASSSEEPHLLDLFGVEAAEGTGAAASDASDPRWRRFTDRAHAAGFRSVQTVPVRLGDDIVGVLALFAAAPVADMRTAQALTDVTGLALLRHSTVEPRHGPAEQVQRAIASRVAVEQAKGAVAELLDLGPADAFTELRRCARVTGQRLSDVATDIVTGFSGPSAAGPGRMLLIRRIHQPGLGRLRADVRAAAARHGLTPARLEAFTLATHEAAANVVDHGGGAGQIILWRRAGSLYAEISDRGRGLPAGYRIPAESPSTGPSHSRRLWMIDRICTGLDIDTGPSGTRLLLRFALDNRI